MQAQPQTVHEALPPVFQHSLDWRFLLPIKDVSKIRVVVEDDSDLGQTLEQVGIPTTNQCSFADIKRNGTDDGQALALPFGLPVRWVGAKPDDQVELLRSLRRLMDPSGYLLLGFNNSWQLWSNRGSAYHPSTPGRVTRQLEQAGFQSVKMFGALPNLSIPEYIFDLKIQTVQFALYHRFRRKPKVLRLFQSLSRMLGWDRMFHFLPCYFAVAIN